jgi:FkbM family methyltransferase
MDEDFAQRVRRILGMARRAGWAGPISHWLARRISRFVPRGSNFRLYSKYSNGGLTCRSGASDLDVFKLIFIDREYRCLDDIPDAELIIDCGANVGYSSAYFLSRFPGCRLIAVEPEESNFALLNKNLRRFHGRFTALHAGVWSRKTGLRMSEAKFGDGREWSYSVREAAPDESPQMDAIDIGSLLRMSGCDRISVLKIDVEGAEKVIFSENVEPWLGRVDVLVIELHGPECERAFESAISAYDFELSTCEELTVARRRYSAS